MSSVSARNAAIRASKSATELEMLVVVVDLVRDRDVARNAEVVRNVEHPHLVAGVGELRRQLADIGVVKAGKIDLRALHPVVPPQRMEIALDELEKALVDRLFERVSSGAAVGIREPPGRRRGPCGRNRRGSSGNT